MIKWYWIAISLLAGLSSGFGFAYFGIRRLLLSVIKPGGSLRPPGKIKPVMPQKEVIDKIVEIAIKGHDLGKTTKEISDEMNNLPEYKQGHDLKKTTEEISEEMHNLPEYKP